MKSYLTPLFAALLVGCPPPPPLTKDDDTDDTDTVIDTETDPTGDDTDSDDPGDDTDPTNPGDDTDPTNPGDDTDPTNPGDDTDDLNPLCNDTTPWTLPGELTTIPQIRQGGRHLPGDLLAMRNAVVVAIKAGSGFTIQDPCADEYAGIYVFTRGDVPDPAIGDVVTVIGEYTEYGGSANPNPQPTAALAEIIVGTSITDSGVTPTGTTTPPAPIPVTIADLASSATAERYESMLVTLRPECLLQITNLGSPIFYEIDVAERGSSAPTARVDNEFYSLIDNDPTLSVGDTWESVTGALYFSFGAYKVAVRSPADAVGFVDGGGPACLPVDTDVDTDTTPDTDVDTDTTPDTDVDTDVTPDTDVDTDTTPDTDEPVDTDPIVPPGPCSGAGTITTIDTIRRRTGGFSNGDLLHVCGAVVTAVGANGFTIQAPGATEYGGLYVYTARNFANPPAVGDNVDVVGVYEEYSGSGGAAPLQTLTELKIDPGSAGGNPGAGVTVTTGTETVTPLVVGLADVANATTTEPLEGMLVRLEESDPLVAQGTPDAASFFEFQVALAGGGTRAEVDNEFFSLATALPTLNQGDTFCAITGIVYFSFSEYKVAVRSLTDAQGYTDGGGTCP